jgi:hypothetical protein
MGSAIRTAWVGLVLGLWSGCADVQAVPMEEGGRCGGMFTICDGDGSLLACEDRVWVRHDCEAVCAEQGEVSSGCGLVIGNDACLCEPDPDAPCAGTTSTCESADVLLQCVDDAWESTSCTVECAAYDPPLTSLGCRHDGDGAACACSLDGTPCDAAGAWCETDEVLATCSAGTWMLETCDGPCEEGEVPRCLPFDGDTAICGCM